MHNLPEPADYLWLVSPAAQSYLSDAQLDTRPLHTQIQSLRKDLSSARAHLILEQVELRRRAAAKFQHAGELFLERTALEQATDDLTASYKAERFPSSVTVADLCTGIGGDLMMLARRGQVLGVERNACLAILAAANAQVAQKLLSESNATKQSGFDIQVQAEDAQAIHVREAAAWHIDPDRRPEGKRTTRVELHQPGPDLWNKLWADNPHGAIKLAPGAEYPAEWEEKFELEWISREGSCRQLVVWSGDLAQAAGQRRATILNDKVRRTVQGKPAIVPQSSTVCDYLYEPDAAVLAADLVGLLAAEHQLQGIIPGGGYLTGDEPRFDLALAGFQVEEVMPFQVKRLKSWLRERAIGRLEIKKRGVDHSPEKLQRELNVPGEKGATLLLTRLDSGVTAILAKRL